MTTGTLTRYPAQPWREHYRSLRWEQGDHLLIAAPTKSGKTTLAANILSKRSHVVVFVSKIKDDTFRNEFKGWTRLESWPRGGPKPYQDKILLWPKAEATIPATLAKMRIVFADALNAITREGKRCAVIDETLMFTDPKYLGFASEVGMMHYWGRSSGLTMVTLCQRPAWIPKIIYSSVTHAYIARTRDTADIKRLSDLGGNVDAKEVGANLRDLRSRHDYLYLNPQGDREPVVINVRK